MDILWTALAIAGWTGLYLVIGFELTLLTWLLDKKERRFNPRKLFHYMLFWPILIPPVIIKLLKRRDEEDREDAEKTIGK